MKLLSLYTLVRIYIFSIIIIFVCWLINKSDGSLDIPISILDVW